MASLEVTTPVGTPVAVERSSYTPTTEQTPVFSRTRSNQTIKRSKSPRLHPSPYSYLTHTVNMARSSKKNLEELFKTIPVRQRRTSE